MATVQAPPFPNFAPVLEKDTPASQGLDEACLERLCERIERTSLPVGIPAPP